MPSKHGDANFSYTLFLPSNSSDLSPIEEAFSKLKVALRRVGARTRESLQEAIGQALLTITPQDAIGWFQHCGYCSLAQGLLEKGSTVPQEHPFDPVPENAIMPPRLGSCS
ncbi:hypothetical protein [Tengunoibacter tsumagoiensis]|uniref:Tc1-like transposase DDE domain-containing protein n=1 Tax=Tengunoibacter tsumagoiensis TaxID=2014871 RepID=A0A402A7M0_9CHLR|nr:hypothetical protein KTT_50160 [Tengunoibacter tsumagoiensis]